MQRLIWSSTSQIEKSGTFSYMYQHDKLEVLGPIMDVCDGLWETGQALKWCGVEAIGIWKMQDYVMQG